MTGHDPHHDGGGPECPKGKPWFGRCPQGCWLNENKPTPPGAGPDLGIGQLLQLLECSRGQGTWAEPGPPTAIKILDNVSHTWIIKVPAGSGCSAMSDDCDHCCPACTTIKGKKVFEVGGAMRMSAPVGNPRYKWVEVWMDDWETLAVKYAKVKQLGARGTGFWTADATQLNQTVIDLMWGAVL